MSKTLNLVVPTGIRNRKTMTFEGLIAEANLHMERAQHHYRAALDAHDGGASSQHLMHLTIIEQNAALLCHQELLHMMMAVLIHSFTEDDEEPQRPGGIVS